ncbi:MAG: TM0106 family RecB-like putative nuclease [Sciscionella sp.]
MTPAVLLDDGVLTRCRRRVHLDNDPTALGLASAATDPTAQARMADAREHRQRIAERLAALHEGWHTVAEGGSAVQREERTRQLLRRGVDFIWNPQLPRDPQRGRRGRINGLIRVGDGYLPLLVVRHRVTDPGTGARTGPLSAPWPQAAGSDTGRKARAQPRDQLRLAHAWRMLSDAGHAAPIGAQGAVIGLDADVVLWHDLTAPGWPGGRSTLAEYDRRFADRIAVAGAAVAGDQPLAEPSRVVECRHCPWWPVCSATLTERRDVSLVVRGSDATALREAGTSTVDLLARLDPVSPPELAMGAGRLHDAIALARAWLADLRMVRRSESVIVPRAGVELDIDMESFGESGAYLWGALLTGVDIGERPGYHSFVTWDPLPSTDEGRSFAEFWTFLETVRAKATDRGLSFAAYCYNELAENRWLLASAERFAEAPGMPSRTRVAAFIDSSQWVDLYRAVAEQFLCAHGKGLKVVAPVAGFAWRDPEAGGENSMRWYREAVGLHGGPPDAAQRARLLRYNEDDVRATLALREWITHRAGTEIPFVGDLLAPR